MVPQRGSTSPKRDIGVGAYGRALDLGGLSKLLNFPARGHQGRPWCPGTEDANPAHLGLLWLLMGLQSHLLCAGYAACHVCGVRHLPYVQGYAACLHSPPPHSKGGHGGDRWDRREETCGSCPFLSPSPFPDVSKTTRDHLVLLLKMWGNQLGISDICRKLTV